jgi:hypothetical protein
MPRALVGLFRGPAQPSSGLRASDRSHSARESEGALGWTWDPRVRQTGATAGWRHVGCSANRFSPLTRSPRWRSNAAAEHPHASAGARRGRLASTCERRGGYVFAEARSAHGTRRSSQRRHTCRGVRGDRRNGRHGRMEACGLLREPLLDGTGDGCDGHQPLDAGIAGSQRAHTPLVPGAFSPSHEGSPVPLERGREAPTCLRWRSPWPSHVTCERRGGYVSLRSSFGARHTPISETGRSDSGRSACGPTSQHWLAARERAACEFVPRDPWPSSQLAGVTAHVTVEGISNYSARHTCRGVRGQGTRFAAGASGGF